MLSRAISLPWVASSLVCLAAMSGACKNQESVQNDAAADRFVAPNTGGSAGGSGSTGGSSGAAGASGGAAGVSAGGAVGGSGGAAGAGGMTGKDAGAGGTKDANLGTDPDGNSRDVSVGTIDGGPVSCSDITSNDRLAVYYYSDSQATGSSSVQMHMDVINFTALSARLTQVTVRYWFTDENAATPNTMEQYYVPLPTTMKFLPVDPPRDGADTVLEFSFPVGPDAGASFVETRGFNFAFHKPSYAGTYDQTNDYSYDPTLTKALGMNPKITAYINGVLAWGCEPPLLPPAKPPADGSAGGAVDGGSGEGPDVGAGAVDAGAGG